MSKDKNNIPRRLWDNGMAYACNLRHLQQGDLIFVRRMKKPRAILQISASASTFNSMIGYGIGNGIGNNQVGRWLGVSRRVGASMCYWLLTSNGNVLSRSTVQRMTRVDRQTPEMAQKIQTFTERVGQKFFWMTITK